MTISIATNKFDIAFLRIACVAANSLSKDPTTKVSAIVVTPDYRQFSIGYNGFAKGFKETDERWKRPDKYKYVIHAEVNSIINSPFDSNSCTVYCTHKPCSRCMLFMINAGIERIVYFRDYSRLDPDQSIVDEASTHFTGGIHQIYDGLCDNLMNNFDGLTNR